MKKKALTYGEYFKDDPLDMVLEYYSIWCSYKGKKIELSDWLEMTYEEVSP